MPTRGDIVVANSVPAWSALAKGTQNKILSMGANDPAWIDAPTLASLISTQVRNSMASAYLNADQNLSDAGWSKINMAHENFDIGGNYDVSNYRYVAPVTGYYQVSWSVGFNYSTHIKTASAGIYVNGSLVGQGGQYQVAGTAYIPYIILSGSRLLYVVSGQYIELYGYCDVDSGTPTADGDSPFNTTTMTVFLVST